MKNFVYKELKRLSETNKQTNKIHILKILIYAIIERMVCVESHIGFLTITDTLSHPTLTRQ